VNRARDRTAPPPAATGQRGFALLALLFAGVLGAAGWLAAGQPRTDDTRAERALSAGERERRAGDALMAHATLYADLYGPTGAGPGHLACPDRHRAAGSIEPADRLPLAGPDPPCAGRPAAVGALPLHITVGRLRAGIDPSPPGGAALAYRVDAAVVNNPRDRPINARNLPAVLARIGARTSGAPLSLRRRVTGPAMRRRVAAWLITRLAARPALQGQVCDGPAGCSPLQALGIVTDAASLIDGVPAGRHWFVRNGWSDDFLLDLDAACRPAPGTCNVRIEAGEGPRMRIRFRPSIPAPMPTSTGTHR